MKFFTMLRSYLKGIRFLGITLAVLMTWAIFCGVFAYGKVQYIRSDVDVLASGKEENAYLLSYFPNAADIANGFGRDYIQQVEADLEGNQLVEDVFSIRVVSPVQYNGETVTLLLYEPEMLAFFPSLQKTGFDFSDTPNGCILSGEQYSGIKAGDTIQLRIGGEPLSFPVCGLLKAPYHRFSLTSSSTLPITDDLFAEDDAIIMQATDEVLETLQSSAKQITYNTNLIAVFWDQTTKESREALLQQTAPKYIYCALETLIENSQEKINKTLKQELPLPIFLAVISTFAFFSVSMLVYKKKQRELAVYYLCGLSRFKSGLVNLAVYQLFAVIPVVINIILIQVWPRINWEGMWADLLLNPDPPTMLMRFLHLFGSIRINNTCLIVVFGYWAVFSVISIAVTLCTTINSIPITYLREVSE